jgi:hypothetical protein
MKWAHAVEKMAPIDLFDAGLPQTFDPEKKPRNICDAQLNEVYWYTSIILCYKHEIYQSLGNFESPQQRIVER